MLINFVCSSSNAVNMAQRVMVAKIPTTKNNLIRDTHGMRLLPRSMFASPTPQSPADVVSSRNISHDVYYRTILTTSIQPLIRWHQFCDIKNYKLRAVSNECCLGFIGQSFYEISHFTSLRYCLRPSKWRVRRPAGRNCRPYDNLRYSSETPFW